MHETDSQIQVTYNKCCAEKRTHGTEHIKMVLHVRFGKQCDMLHWRYDTQFQPSLQSTVF